MSGPFTRKIMLYERDEAWSWTAVTLDQGCDGTVTVSGEADTPDVAVDMAVDALMSHTWCFGMANRTQQPDLRSSSPRVQR